MKTPPKDRGSTLDGPPTIVCLGSGSTTELSFSNLAYRRAVKDFPWMPRFDNLETRVIEPAGNAGIVPELEKHPGSYGILPINTMAGGRIDESLFSLVRLRADTPITALAAYRMRISFSLFGRPDIDIERADGVLGHPRALQACEGTIKQLGIPGIPVDNNAIGMKLVRTEAMHKHHLALGPNLPTKGLEVKSALCEDHAAYTTFLLLHNGVEKRKESTLHTRTYNALIAFDVEHIPGQLAQVLTHLDAWNLTHLSSMYDSNLFGYRFFGEIECSKDSRTRLQRELMALARAPGVSKLTSFGPYPLMTSDHSSH